MFKARCAKKVHSDDVLHEEKSQVEGTLQGKDDVFRHVASRNDKLRDVFRGARYPLNVFAARRQYGHNALRLE